MSTNDKMAAPEGLEGVSHRQPVDLWDAAASLWQGRKVIAVVTTTMAVAAVVIALLLPREYAAEARVLQPEAGPLSLFGISAAGPAGGISSLLMGGGGTYSRYLAILSSHSTMQEMVDAFDLEIVYDLSRNPNPSHLAVEKLRDKANFLVDRDFNHLTVRVYDRDPERAAAMANHFVGILNRRNAELSSENARQSRVFIETRLNRAMADMDSIRAALQAFQEEHGVVELESQAQAFLQTVAATRGEVARLEVQHHALTAQYGADNPRAQATAEALRMARAQMGGALQGQEALLPVSLQHLPAVSRRYAELMQGRLVHSHLMEALFPLYEQALFQERNETAAVQVLDPALPPVLAAKPARRVIVAVTTLSGFVLACMFVLLHAWLWRNRSQFSGRLQRRLSVPTA